MAIVPKNIPDKVKFFQDRGPIWTSSATVIGLAAGDMTLMNGKVTAAANALATATAAQNASKAATINLHATVQDMGDLGADLIKKIKAKAGQDGDGVYAIALLPVPATPSPMPPPGQPTDLKVELTQTGALDLTWKCPNPTGSTGTIYNVFRSTTGAVDSFTFIGGSGVREFTDESAPSVGMLVYKIQAVRSTSVGPFATFNVYLGTGSSGATVVQSVVNTSPKMAA